MTETFWIGLGLFAQVMFSARFFVQWIYSERRKRSVIPVAFWYFSLAGGATLFIYALHIGDPVFILGQSMGVLIYTRNLYFIHKRRQFAGAG